jgi:hypothetical protein
LASPRWAHCSAHFHGCLSTPKPPPCTHRAYTPACWPNRTAWSPEHKLSRLPPSSLRRVPLPAWAPQQPTLPGPPLGHMEATRAAHCWVLPLFSPGSELPRPRHHCSIAAARWWHLRPIHCYQSREGKANFNPVPFVCLRQAHIAGGDLPSAVGAMCVKHFWTRGPDC